MGSYDGAELCELVRTYILYHLGQEFGIKTSGLYRDDGLNCTKNVNPSQLERSKKKVVKLFKEKFDLKITIETNLKVVNFLDVTLDLNTGTYRPYAKPNSNPIYVNVDSNHPPNIIKQIPSMIANRISRISSNKDTFDRVLSTMIPLSLIHISEPTRPY